MIFQDPISSLNPRRKVEDIVAEGLDIWKIGDDASRDGQGPTRCSRPSASTPTGRGPKRPHEFSGGQCQRISIARAVATDPKLIICDEPVSALDVSVQAQILNLLEDMKARYGLTLVFIAHDLAVVKNVSDRVAVMYLGKICEVAPPDDALRGARAPVHRGAARRDPGARPDDQRPSSGRRRRRAPVAARPAERLPVPHPLPAGARTCCAEEEPHDPRGRGPTTSSPATSRSRSARSSPPPHPAVAAPERRHPRPDVRRSLEADRRAVVNRRAPSGRRRIARPSELDGPA